MMMLEQPPNAFAGLALVGGEAALDFLNSVRFRGRADGGEALTSFAALADWAEVAGVISTRERATLAGIDDHAALASGLRLRERFRAFMAAPQDTGTCRQLEEALRPYRPRVRVSPQTAHVSLETPVESPDDLVERLRATLIGFLTGWDPDRTRECAADDCDWVFVDRTKAARRKWCDSRTCGNRDRVRRHRKGDPVSEGLV